MQEKRKNKERTKKMEIWKEKNRKEKKKKRTINVIKRKI